MQSKKQLLNKIIAWCVGVWVLASCSTTKHLAEGEVLYIGMRKTEIANKNVTPMGIKALEEAEAAIAVAPNNAVLGSTSMRWHVPVGLWIFNHYQRYEKGIGKWIFKKFASTPVYLSTVNPETRVKVASNLLHDYGFFNGKVTYRVDSTAHPKKSACSML